MKILLVSVFILSLISFHSNFSNIQTIDPREKIVIKNELNLQEETWKKSLANQGKVNDKLDDLKKAKIMSQKWKKLDDDYFALIVKNEDKNTDYLNRNNIFKSNLTRKQINKYKFYQKIIKDKYYLALCKYEKLLHEKMEPWRKKVVK